MASSEALLPPGFRFHPTDEELILHYLRNRAASLPCPIHIIAELDVYKFDPWDLPARAVFGDKEWYFFTPRDRKYPNGIRPNRAAGSGYWKATGIDKQILTRSAAGRSTIAGVKKALVFYVGKPPKGTKANWIMHEYRLTGDHSTTRPPRPPNSSMRLDDWVLCRIYMKNDKSPSYPKAQESLTMEPDQYLPLPANLPQQKMEHPQHTELSVLLPDDPPDASRDADLFSIMKTSWDGPGQNGKALCGSEEENCCVLCSDGADYWKMLLMNSHF